MITSFNFRHDDALDGDDVMMMNAGRAALSPLQRATQCARRASINAVGMTLGKNCNGQFEDLPCVNLDFDLRPAMPSSSEEYWLKQCDEAFTSKTAIDFQSTLELSGNSTVSTTHDAS